MTALSQYQRLECIGLWRESPQAQRRNVGVSFGDSSLIIADLRSNEAITHWSLPAICRLNPGVRPALFAPAPEAAELLELDEPDMITALETVHRAIDKQRAGPGPLRFYVAGGSVLLLLALGIFWMPEALYRHAASVVPPSKRAEIGRRILADMGPGLGLPCTEPAALDQLAALRNRLLGPDAGEMMVVSEGVAGAMALPGGLILVGRQVIEQYDGPDVAAGHILAEQLRADLDDPVVPLLRSAGFAATLSLLTTGDLPPDATAGYGTGLLTAARPDLPAEALLQRFVAAAVASTPYAQAVSPGALPTDPLIQSDPFRTAPAPEPVLTDDAWVSLQGICSI